MKYRKKPVVIEAVRYQPNGPFEPLEVAQDRVTDFVGGNVQVVGVEIQIPTLEGTMTAQVGDYIIRGVKGEFYPCKPDIFEVTYEAVETETAA